MQIREMKIRRCNYSFWIYVIGNVGINCNVNLVLDEVVVQYYDKNIFQTEELYYIFFIFLFYILPCE